MFLSFFNFQLNESAFEQGWKEWLNIVVAVSSACFSAEYYSPPRFFDYWQEGVAGQLGFLFSLSDHASITAKN